MTSAYPVSTTGFGPWEQNDTGKNLVYGMQTETHRSDHPKVASASANGPEEFIILRAVGPDSATVGQNKLGTE
jgi:hypothetical protein